MVRTNASCSSSGIGMVSATFLVSHSGAVGVRVLEPRLGVAIKQTCAVHDW